MNRISKLLLVLVSIMFVFGPCLVYATDDNVEGGEVQNQENTNVNNEQNEEPDVTEPEEDEPVVEQKSIKFDMDGTESTLKTGETLLLKVIVTPSDSQVTWVSSDPDVARVDNTGLITALDKSGDAIITAKLNDVLKVEYKINVDAPKSTVSTLKSLTVNGTLTPEFKADVFEYSVNLDKDVTSIDFEYELSDSNAKAFLPSVSKNKDLKNGDVLTFKVVAEDGVASSSYKFTVVKEASSLDLKSLYINGYALNEVFDSSITEYTASIPYEIDTITVKAGSVASNSEVITKISGITKLKVGENTVKVVVTDITDSTKSKVYKIIVTREEKVSIEEKPTSIITSSGVVDGNNSDSNSNSSNNSTNDRGDVGTGDDFLKYAIVSLACLILFAIGGIGIYFYVKTSPRRLKKMIVDDKKEESPIVETSSDNISKNQENIEAMMDEKLIETREFKQEDLQQLVETENLFNDEEDV